MAHYISCHKIVIRKETEKPIFENIYPIYGLPNDIILDKDTQFTSNFWRGFFQLLGIKINLFTTYFPQTDGQIECKLNLRAIPLLYYKLSTR